MSGLLLQRNNSRQCIRVPGTTSDTAEHKQLVPTLLCLDPSKWYCVGFLLAGRVKGIPFDIQQKENYASPATHRAFASTACRPRPSSARFDFKTLNGRNLG